MSTRVVTIGRPRVFYPCCSNALMPSTDRIHEIWMLDVHLIQGQSLGGNAVQAPVPSGTDSTASGSMSPAASFSGARFGA
jgi:hypothetical protein